MVAVSIVQVLAIIVVFSLLSVFGGSAVWRRDVLDPEGRFPSVFHAASEFFVGLALLLCAWKVCAGALGDARVGLVVAGTGLLALGIHSMRRKEVLPGRGLGTPYVVAVGLLTVSIDFMRALVPVPDFYLQHPDEVSPFLGFGPIFHGFRAANIAIYIAEHNLIPVLNQNIGQSLLAAIPQLCGLAHPNLALVLWHGVCMSFFVLLVYGLVRRFTASVAASAFGAGVVMLGNSALSLSTIEIIDTRSTEFFCASIDTLLGVATFPLFCVALFQLLQKRAGDSAYFALVMALLAVFWNLVGAQTIILAFAALAACGFLLLRQRRSVAELFVPGVVLLGAAVFGALQGGMLLRKSALQEYDIPGVMVVARPGQPALSLRRPGLIGVDYHTVDGLRRVVRKAFGRPDNPREGPKDRYPHTPPPRPLAGRVPADELARLPRGELLTTLWELTRHNVPVLVADTVDSLRRAFFVFLGVAVGIIAVRRRMFTDAATHTAFTSLVAVSTVLIAAGCFICYPFALYGYAWELTRFLALGNFLGKVILGACLARVLAVHARRPVRVAAAATGVLMMFGPTMQMIVDVGANTLMTTAVTDAIALNDEMASFRNAPMIPLSMLERVDALVNMRVTVGKRIK